MKENTDTNFFNYLEMALTIFLIILIIILLSKNSHMVKDLSNRIRTILSKATENIRVKSSQGVEVENVATAIALKAQEFVHKEIEKKKRGKFKELLIRTLRVYDSLIYMPLNDQDSERYNLLLPPSVFNWFVIISCFMIVWVVCLVLLLIIQMQQEDRELEDINYVLCIPYALLAAICAQPLLFLFIIIINRAYLIQIKKSFKMREEGEFTFFESPMAHRKHWWGNKDKEEPPSTSSKLYSNREVSEEMGGVQRRLSFDESGDMSDMNRSSYGGPTQPLYGGGRKSTYTQMGEEGVFGRGQKKRDFGKYLLIYILVFASVMLFAGICCYICYLYISTVATLCFLTFLLAFPIDIFIFRFLICLLIALLSKHKQETLKDESKGGAVPEGVAEFEFDAIREGEQSFQRFKTYKSVMMQTAGEPMEDNIYPHMSASNAFSNVGFESVTPIPEGHPQIDPAAPFDHMEVNPGTGHFGSAQRRPHFESDGDESSPEVKIKRKKKVFLQKIDEGKLNIGKFEDIEEMVDEDKTPGDIVPVPVPGLGLGRMLLPRGAMEGGGGHKGQTGHEGEGLDFHPNQTKGEEGRSGGQVGKELPTGVGAPGEGDPKDTTPEPPILISASVSSPEKSRNEGFPSPTIIPMKEPMKTMPLNPKDLEGFNDLLLRNIYHTYEEDGDSIVANWKQPNFPKQILHTTAKEKEEDDIRAKRRESDLSVDNLVTDTPFILKIGNTLEQDTAKRETNAKPLDMSFSEHPNKMLIDPTPREEDDLSAIGEENIIDLEEEEKENIITPFIVKAVVSGHKENIKEEKSEEREKKKERGDMEKLKATEHSTSATKPPIKGNSDQIAHRQGERGSTPGGGIEGSDKSIGGARGSNVGKEPEGSGVRAEEDVPLGRVEESGIRDGRGKGSEGSEELGGREPANTSGGGNAELGGDENVHFEEEEALHGDQNMNTAAIVAGGAAVGASAIVANKSPKSKEETKKEREQKNKSNKAKGDHAGKKEVTRTNREEAGAKSSAAGAKSSAAGAKSSEAGAKSSEAGPRSAGGKSSAVGGKSSAVGGKSSAVGGKSSEGGGKPSATHHEEKREGMDSRRGSKGKTKKGKKITKRGKVGERKGESKTSNQVESDQDPNKMDGEDDVSLYSGEEATGEKEAMIDMPKAVPVPIPMAIPHGHTPQHPSTIETKGNYSDIQRSELGIGPSPPAGYLIPGFPKKAFLEDQPSNTIQSKEIGTETDADITKRRIFKRQISKAFHEFDEKIEAAGKRGSVKRTMRRLKSQIKKKKLMSQEEFMILKDSKADRDRDNSIYYSHSDSDAIEDNQVAFTGNKIYKPEDLSDYSLDEGDMVYYEKDDMTQFSKALGLNKTQKKPTKYWSDVDIDLSSEQEKELKKVEAKFTGGKSTEGVSVSPSGERVAQKQNKKKLGSTARSMKGRSVWDDAPKAQGRQRKPNFSASTRINRRKKAALTDKRGLDSQRGLAQSKSNLNLRAKKQLPPVQRKMEKSRSVIGFQGLYRGDKSKEKAFNSTLQKGTGNDPVYAFGVPEHLIAFNTERDEKKILFDNVKRKIQMMDSDSPYAEPLYKRFKQFEITEGPHKVEEEKGVEGRLTRMRDVYQQPRPGQIKRKEKTPNKGPKGRPGVSLPPLPRSTSTTKIRPPPGGQRGMLYYPSPEVMHRQNSGNEQISDYSLGGASEQKSIEQLEGTRPTKYSRGGVRGGPKDNIYFPTIAPDSPTPQFDLQGGGEEEEEAPMNYYKDFNQYEKL